VAFDGRESVQLLGVSSSALFRSGSGPNRSELFEFPSEHFSGRENNSEFLSVEKKNEEYFQNSESFSGRENNSEFSSVEKI
jgi:hypothetical protein